MPLKLPLFNGKSSATFVCMIVLKIGRDSQNQQLTQEKQLLEVFMGTLGTKLLAGANYLFKKFI